MRTYLSESNLKYAMLLGAIATFLSIPRFIQSHLSLWLYIPTAWAAMTLVAGAATAWGKCGGMCGLFPPRRRSLIGIAIAAGIVVALTPLYIYWIDPIGERIIAAGGSRQALSLRYPTTVAGCLALMLWSASFEVIFFQAGTLSFFARLIGSQWLAIGLAVALRLYVVSLQFSHAGITESAPLFLVASAVLSLTTCLLYARAGLLAAMVFAAGQNVHLLFRM